MVGANRIVRGVAITNPFGGPDRGTEGERALRRRIVERAFDMLETEVAPTTVWDVDDV